MIFVLIAAMMLMSPFIGWVMMMVAFNLIYKRKKNKKWASALVGFFSIGFYWGVMIMVNFINY